MPYTGNIQYQSLVVGRQYLRLWLIIDVPSGAPGKAFLAALRLKASTAMGFPPLN